MDKGGARNVEPVAIRNKELSWGKTSWKRTSIQHSTQRSSGDSDMKNNVYNNLIDKVLDRNNLNDAY